MQLPFLLLVLLSVWALFAASLCLWLGLKFFGFKLNRLNSVKVVGLEVLFLLITSVMALVLDGSLGTLLGLGSFMGGLVLWAFLLKRFAAGRYSPVRAASSYVVGYILIVCLQLTVAIIGLASVAQFYEVDGDSMAPTLRNSQRVLVYKFDKQPEVDDLLGYRTPSGAQGLGRVQGVPGQTVDVPGSSLEIDGRIQQLTSLTLNDGQYLVTVDNSKYDIPPRVISRDAVTGVIGSKF